jgi:hypothetical protein
MYLVSSHYNGINIGDMRLLPTEEKAWEYADTLIPDHVKENPTRYKDRQKFVDSCYLRVYLLSATEPPKLQKRKK